MAYLFVRHCKPNRDTQNYRDHKAEHELGCADTHMLLKLPVFGEPDDFDDDLGRRGEKKRFFDDEPPSQFPDQKSARN